MNGRRPFLVAFLLTAAVWAGVAAPVALTPDEPAPATPRPNASAGPNIAAEGRSRAAGRQALGLAWSSTWAATVPEGSAVPDRALGAGRCAALFTWATEHSAVPRGTATAAFTLTAPGDRGLVVRSLRVVKGRALPPPRGTDVECLGAVDRGVPPSMESWGRLNLDRPRDLKVSRTVPPGATVGGVIETRTTGCSCQWWIEAEVWEGDRRRTIRIDDAGSPFTLAPPVAGIGTPAQGAALKYGTTDLALAREDATVGRPSDALSVSASRLLAENGQEMWMVADRKVPEVSRLAANLDVPGAVCQRMERLLAADGALPAGRAAYAVSIAGPSALKDPERIVDVALNVRKTVRAGPPPQGYGCYPALWGLQSNDSRSAGTARLSRDTPHLPVLTGEPAELLRETDGEPATSTLFFTVEAWGPDETEYHFTLDVTVEDNSGNRTHHTVDDAGRPFVLAARPDGMTPRHEKYAYHENGHRNG
ncbi:hypothetical protein [Streptomyces albidoflavus]|uniref:hypothetical protein n=1 Tax=Streptomyces albidoflavus TaxID=1886 RepID=UPI0033F99E11|nr:hypothetical protein OG794_01950 [Streptomyces albidoflavus]